jgi:hypothetical protein
VHQVFKSGSSALRLFLSFVSDCALSIVNHYCVVSNSITFPPPTNFWLPTKRKFWCPYGFQSNVTYAYVRLLLQSASHQAAIQLHNTNTLHYTKFANLVIHLYDHYINVKCSCSHSVNVSLRRYTFIYSIILRDNFTIQ